MVPFFYDPLMPHSREQSSKPGSSTKPGYNNTLLLLGLLTLAALLSFRSIDDLDYGIHIATGRWIIKNGAVPTTDPFSWSFAQHAYIAYHWGFQILVATLESTFGTIGPVLMRCVMILSTALVIARSLKIRSVDPLIGVMCGVLAIIATEWRFSLRPELFSNLLIALTVLVIELKRRGSRTAVFALPLIFLVWVNTHIYILGFVVIGIELLVDTLTKRLNRSFVIATALALIALLINPYGWQAVQEPLRLITRMDSSNIFAQHISELSSPFALHKDPRTPFNLHAQIGCWIALLALSLPAAWGLLRLQRYSDLLVLALFALLSTLAVRNLPLFIIAALPAIATGLSEIAPTLLPSLERRRRIYTAIIAGIVLVLCIRVGTGAWYATQRRNLHLAPLLESASLAIESADFVRTHALVGRGFNNLNVGGALLLRAPDHRIFIDGRNEVTGEEFFKRYLAIMNPAAFPAFATKEQIEYVVLSHIQSMDLLRSLVASGAWTVVHYDAVAVVLVRKAGPNGALPPKPLPAQLAEDAMRWKMLGAIYVQPTFIESLSRWLLGGEELPEDLSHLGTFLLTAGYWREAEPLLLEAAIRAPNFWETSNNLGALYTRLQMWEAATHVYRMVLMLNPSNVLAQNRARASWSQFQLSKDTPPASSEAIAAPSKATP